MGVERKYTKSVTLLDAETSTGVGGIMNVAACRFVTLAISGDNTANLTVQIQGSIQDDVDFSSAASPANQWDYVSVIDLEPGTPLAGATGIVFSGDDTKLVEVNANGLTKLTANLTARTGGDVTVKAVQFDAQ